MIQAKPYLREVVLQRKTIADDSIYPFNSPALRRLDRIEFHADVTFIVGDNGTGKSTLIEAIAMKWGYSQKGGTKIPRQRSILDEPEAALSPQRQMSALVAIHELVRALAVH